MVPLPPPTRRRQHGVSLVEALMALAVMAFGMLALVGVQTTLRLNSDLSKQRSEATRIASEEIEGARVFTTVAPQAGQTDWLALASHDAQTYVPPDGIGNTSYRVRRDVAAVPGTQQVTVHVQVQWNDRTGQEQTVTLDTVIVGAAPVLSGVLALAPVASPTNQIDGRDPTIPREAVIVGEQHDRSAFKPFDAGTVVWVFNNATGEIVSRCTGVATAQAAITLADLSHCTDVYGRRIAGAVRFDLNTTASSRNPRGISLPLNGSTPLVFASNATSPVNQSQPMECVTDSHQPQGNRNRANDASDPITWTRLYECVVFPADATGWGGKLNVVAAGTYPNGDNLPDARGRNAYQVCRYTTASVDYTANADHPLSYCVENASPAPTASLPCNGQRVTHNLLNQNFLIISADASCPGDDAATPLINENTRSHQSSP